MSKPGAQEYYDSVFQLIASWDVDYVKVDDLSRTYDEHQPEIEAIRKAIDNTSRPIVLSTSPGETPLAAADHVATHANMWRISDDFWDSWKLLKPQFERAKTGRSILARPLARCRYAPVRSRSGHAKELLDAIHSRRAIPS